MGVMWMEGTERDALRAATPSTRDVKKAEGKKRAFGKLIAKAETAREMAQEHHKNKFAIIHFDSSAGKGEIGNAQQTTQPKQVCQLVGGGENLHFYFSFAASFLLPKQL